MIEISDESLEDDVYHAKLVFFSINGRWWKVVFVVFLNSQLSRVVSSGFPWIQRKKTNTEVSTIGRTTQAASITF